MWSLIQNRDRFEMMRFVVVVVWNALPAIERGMCEWVMQTNFGQSVSKCCIRVCLFFTSISTLEISFQTHTNTLKVSDNPVKTAMMALMMMMLIFVLLSKRRKKVRFLNLLISNDEKSRRFIVCIIKRYRKQNNQRTELCRTNVINFTHSPNS